MEIFDGEIYKFISEYIESKVKNLRNNKDFNEKYLKLYEKIDEVEKELKGEQKEKFDEIIKFFYQTEEYYFAYSYLLGIKEKDI